MFMPVSTSQMRVVSSAAAVRNFFPLRKKAAAVARYSCPCWKPLLAPDDKFQILAVRSRLALTNDLLSGEKARAENRVLVPGEDGGSENVKLFVVFQVPDLGRLVVAAGEQLGFHVGQLRRESHRSHAAGMAPQGLEQLALLDVPDADRVVVAAAGQEFAVGRELQGGYARRVALQGIEDRRRRFTIGPVNLVIERLDVLRLPEQDPFVVTGRGNEPAVGREAGGIDGARVALERRFGLLGGGRPDDHRAVLAGGDDPRLLFAFLGGWSKGHGKDPAFMAFEDLGRTRFQVPEDARAIVGTGKQSLAVLGISKAEHGVGVSR